MTTRDDDDRELEAFLAGEDALSALLRQTPQPAPPPELDARILAQARIALAQPPAAANDPVPRPWLQRARMPLGLAATVVLGLSLTLRWNGWHDEPPAGVLADSVPLAPAPAAAPARQDVPAPDAAPARTQDGAPAEAPAPMRAPASARRPRTMDGMPAKPAPEAVQPAPPPPPPPSAPAAPAVMPAPAPAASAKADADAPYARAPGNALRAPAPAPVAVAPAPQAPPPASNAVEVSGSRIGRAHVLADAAHDDPRAQQWLDLIAGLLDRRLDGDARDAWQQFRRDYPDYPVPAALQARIDALPPAR
jgi:hypothetical protein